MTVALLRICDGLNSALASPLLHAGASRLSWRTLGELRSRSEGAASPAYLPTPCCRARFPDRSPPRSVPRSYAALLRDVAADGHRSVVTDEACGTVTHMVRHMTVTHHTHITHHITNHRDAHGEP